MDSSDWEEGENGKGKIDLEGKGRDGRMGRRELYVPEL